MTGFAPINFNLVGKIVLTIGIIIGILSVLAKLTNWFELTDNIIFIGVGFIVVGLYLINMIPKDK